MAAASRWAMGMQLDILAVQIILAVSFWGPIVDSWTRQGYPDGDGNGDGTGAGTVRDGPELQDGLWDG